MRPVASWSPLSRGGFLLLLIVFTALWFGPLDIRHLIAADEGRNAEIAREMWIGGDWLMPHYNGYRFPEIAPLQTWITALSFTLFGQGDWQARLWPALSGFGAVLMVGYTGARVFHRRAGFYAALVLASSPFWNVFSHYGARDAGFASLMTLTLCTLLLAQHPASATRARRGWMALCWASTGLAVLSDGAMGLMIPAASIAVYGVLAGDKRIWQRLYLLSGGLLFCAITVPWFALMQQRQPGFLRTFFIDSDLHRFTHADHAPGSLLFYLPVLVCGFLPWLSTLVSGVRQAWQLPRQTNGFSPVILLCIWVALILVFFSFAQSQMIALILPVTPALALLCGPWLPAISREQWQRHLTAYAVLLIAAMVAVLYLSNFGDLTNPNALYRRYQAWIWLTLSIGLSGITCAALANWPGRLRRAKDASALSQTLFALSWLLMISLAGNAHEIFGRDSSGALLATPVKARLAQLPADTPFYAVDMLDATLPFYIGHTMILVQRRDELGPAIDVDTRRWIPTVAAWRAIWLSDTDALAMMSPQRYKSLLARGLPMQVVAQDARRVIVARRGDARPMPQD